MHDLLRRITRKSVPSEEFWALRDISLSIRGGESVAIVGRNGAGKSTLLRVIAGTVFASSGDVRTRGRIGALLELGAGFHPDLTGRENVFMNASLLGLQRDEVESAFDEIVAFSGLADFIDEPLRNYSSGMQVRLGFSVAAHIQPDIVIMDEVFAVGDQEFQKKCLGRIASFKAQSKTLLFVTHGLEVLRGICERAVWLDHGRLCADGTLDDVLRQYKASC
jgi:ABC-type polysaccharide/polyol phosphate transport system ATPase subunit